MKNAQNIERVVTQAWDKWGGSRKELLVLGRTRPIVLLSGNTPTPCSIVPLPLGLFGATRRYQLVDEPSHQHDDAQHDRNPEKLQCESDYPQDYRYQLDGDNKGHQAEHESQKCHN